MSFHHLDQYAHLDSAVTRRPPVVRLLGSVLVALGAASLPLGAWAQLAVLAAVVVALAAASRIRPGVFLARLAAPLGFVLLVSVAVLFLAPGEAIARVGPLRVTDAGALRFGSAVGRGGVALGAAVVLVSTTRFTDLLEALRILRLPGVVTISLGLAYRFLYLLNDEVDRLRRAARSRNAGDGSASRRRLAVGIAAAALQRSFDRSERVHQAMLARGFSGHMPALRSPTRSGHPWVELAVLTTLVGGVVASAWL